MALSQIPLLLATALTITATPSHDPPTVTPPETCAWRIAARDLYRDLYRDTTETEPRNRALLQKLHNSGVTDSDFIPDDCHATPPADASDADASDASEPGPATRAGTPSAGETFSWGQPDVIDDFNGDLSGWNLYDGPGHGGNGTRSPDAATTADGILTINGTGDGTTTGMAWTPHSQKYGRWEVRMRAPKGSPSYNALALLWPTEENFPLGGEIDFAEIMDPDRNKIEMFLHYGEDNSQVHGEVDTDATQWHNYAVEWTPDSITTFIDGKEWWKTTDTSILPPGPMHLCLQLDWFPKGDKESGRVQYDWVKQWSLTDTDTASTSTSGSEGSTDDDSSTTATDDENNWNSDTSSQARH